MTRLWMSALVCFRGLLMSKDDKTPNPSRAERADEFAGSSAVTPGKSTPIS